MQIYPQRKEARKEVCSAVQEREYKTSLAYSVLIRQVPADALIDTGTECSLINEQFLAQLHKPVEITKEGRCPAVYDVQGHPLKVKGKITMEMQQGGQSTTVEA